MGGLSHDVLYDALDARSVAALLCTYASVLMPIVARSRQATDAGVAAGDGSSSSARESVEESQVHGSAAVQVGVDSQLCMLEPCCVQVSDGMGTPLAQMFQRFGVVRDQESHNTSPSLMHVFFQYLITATRDCRLCR